MGVGGRRHLQVPFLPGKWHGTHWIWGWIGPSAGLDGYGKLRPQRVFEPRTVQFVASRYTDGTIPAILLRTSIIIHNWYHSSLTLNSWFLEMRQEVTRFVRNDKNCEKPPLASKCLSVLPSALNNSTHMERIFVKFGIWVLFEISRENSSFIKSWEE